ncbi:MAG: hypothetical protein LBK27_08675 [Treponema sp.]|nr:hypothetical protein [Treponema sp.]
MNKYIFPALTLFAFLSFFACGSVDPAKRYPLMVADQDPVFAGMIEAEFDRSFSARMDKKEIEVFFYPRYNAVVLEFRHELVRYRQFWDPGNRRLFIQALDSYRADFAARNLVNTYFKTAACYGKFTGAAEWETSSLSFTGHSSPRMELGYRFRNETPYFSVRQRAAPNERGHSDRGTSNSLQIIMYYTRAQAEELTKLFDQDYLMSLLAPVRNDPEPAKDEYREDADAVDF